MVLVVAARLVDGAHAAAVYRTACNQLGIPSFEPPPVFNELVEVGDIGCEGTKQCYAIAEAIRVCAPLAIKVTNAFLTDEGAARIIQAAIWCGKLRSLSISGSILSYKTCLAIQAGLRASGGANLSELSLTACGLGGWLEDGPPIPLPTSAEEKYQRAKDELWHGAPAAYQELLGVCNVVFTFAFFCAVFVGGAGGLRLGVAATTVCGFTAGVAAAADTRLQSL